jgi:type-F conjugative transfer system pilin assembly thiol-disulfide isomerase TrbB
MDKLIMMLLLLFHVLNVEASHSLWLGKLIAKREGSRVEQGVQANKKQDRGFFKTHGLILFYSSLCPHCRQFAPVLKGWAVVHRAEILPLSFDNQTLPEFPNFLPATTEWVNDAFQGNAIQYPALFIANLTTKVLYPVGFGSMSEQELNARMKGLIIKITAYENQGNAP